MPNRPALMVPADIRSPLVRGLVQYWERLCSGRFAPSWREIDPAHIKPMLPYLCVSAAIESPFDLRYRLVGTRIIDAAGGDFTGQTLGSMSVIGGAAQWLDYYQEIVSSGTPRFGRYVGRLNNEPIHHADYAGLPLSDDGTKVNRILEIEDWSTAESIVPSKMKSLSWDFEAL